MELQMQRSYFKEGTNSVLFINGVFLGFTIELPWNNNTKSKSCVPEGTYFLKARFSKKFRHHLVLENVDQRSLILIHPANNAKVELRGCIAPVTYLTGIGKGLYSKPLLDKILSICHQAFERKEIVELIIKSSS
tara:strand:- start:562 stop:963 length:402 start_codon:yes stop_codon:yes gene_type:complete